MKKTLLLWLALLATAGMSYAQMICSAGYYIRPSGKEAAVLYVNGEQTQTWWNDEYNFVGKAVVIKDGNIFFAYNKYDGSGSYCSYVRNCGPDGTANEEFLAFGDNTWISDMYLDASNSLWFVGEKKTGGIWYATVWNQSGYVMQSYGDGTHDVRGLCGCCPFGNNYVGGSQNTSSLYYGAIWYRGNELYALPTGTMVKDIAYYGEHLYSVVESGISPFPVYVYENDHILYTLLSGSNNNRAFSICIDGGDIYVSGREGSENKVWKNGEPLYTNYIEGYPNIVSVCANSDGVYYQGAVGNVGKIWKDGVEVYSLGEVDPSSLNDFCVEPPACEFALRTLPYFEGFETGETDWECWTKIDVDNDNGSIADGYHASYWDRSGWNSYLNYRTPHTGDHAAVHRYAGVGHPQEGWLITPPIQLSPNKPVLSFYSSHTWPSDYDYEGVWISTNSNPTNTGSYVELWRPSGVTEDWEEVTVDLSAYRGQIVYIAFKYTGENAHEWYIDDVTITEAAPTYMVSAMPNNALWGSVTGGGTYPEGAQVTLTAVPMENARFKDWNDGNYANPRTITVTNDVTFVANFELRPLYTIIVESLNPDMGSVVGGGTFAEGTEITIQAVPKSGYYFNGWNDGNHANPRTITVTGNATYEASFSTQQTQTYILTVTCNPSEGYVEGTGSYTAGTKVTVKATAWSGYKFDKWDDGNKMNPRQVTVNDNVTLVALFKKTGVGEYGETMLSLYPNPTKDNLRIIGVEADETVEVYNNLGMLVKVCNTNVDKEIHVGDLAAGLYMIRCGKKTARFIKE